MWFYIEWIKIDLSIAIKNIKDNSKLEEPDSDDDDQPDTIKNTKKAKSQIGNVHEKLTSAKCQYVDKKADGKNVIEKSRFLSQHFDEFKKKLETAKVSKFDEKTCYVIFLIYYQFIHYTYILYD